MAIALTGQAAVDSVLVPPGISASLAKRLIAVRDDTGAQQCMYIPSRDVNSSSNYLICPMKVDEWSPFSLISVLDDIQKHLSTTFIDFHQVPLQIMPVKLVVQQ